MTADTPPSISTSGCEDWMPQKSPNVISEPQERLAGQAWHEGLKRAFFRKSVY